MKHIYILLFAMLLSGCGMQQERVVEYPEYLGRNSSVLEVSKVVLNDSSTVLHFYAKADPNSSIQIESDSYITDNNGREYNVISGLGISLGEYFMIPETGNAEFRLVFPPLDREVSSIDFTEGGMLEEGCSIWGIQLKGKLPELDLPEDLQSGKDMYLEDLPSSELNYGTAIIQGKLMDYHFSMGNKLRILHNDIINFQSTQTEVEVQPDGSFTAELKLLAPSSISIIFSGVTRMVAEPGRTTRIYINLREMRRQGSQFHKDDGPYGELFYTDSPWETVMKEHQEYYASLKTFNIRFSLDRKKVADMNLDMNAYKEYLLEEHADIQARIDKLPICAATRKVLTFCNRGDAFYNLYAAPGDIGFAYSSEKGLDREQNKTIFQELMERYPEDYIDETYFEEISDPRFLPFLSYTFASSCAKDAMERQKIQPSEYPSLSELSQSRELMKSIVQLIPLSEAQEAELKGLPQAYAEYIENANNELLDKLGIGRKKSGYTINEIGDVANEDLFKSIINRYSGKVVFIDFWETWCHWCKTGHEQMAPVKKEMKDKDIVWLYIAGGSSPEESWKNMIPDIPGEHYRLTAGQEEHISKEFDFSSVPTYMILDRTGTIKFKQEGFSSAGHLKEELLKVL